MNEKQRIEEWQNVLNIPKVSIQKKSVSTVSVTNDLVSVDRQGLRQTRVFKKNCPRGWVRRDINLYKGLAGLSRLAGSR
jgi:hypothetical protein